MTESPDFEEFKGIAQIRVVNVDSALRAIGAGARDAYRGKVVAITGSVGKTTTKNLLAHTLELQKSVYVKLDNQNGLRSIINRLLQLQSEDIAIFEVARIALPEASLILKPDVSVITAVAEAHMSALDSLENTAMVKASIVHGMTSSGTVIINADTNHAETLIQTAQDQGCRVVPYSAERKVDVYMIGYDPATRTVQAVMGKKRLEYTLNLIGEHNALNSLSVLAVIDALGESVEDYLPALETFEPVKARGTIIETSVGDHSVLLVDDSYNANPTSMAASLNSFRDSFPDRRKILILGDMLELGPREESFHADLSREVLRADASRIYLVGPLMRHLWPHVPKDLRGAHVMEAKDLLQLVPAELEDGDAILLKASNGTGLKVLVQGWAAPRVPETSWHLTIEGKVHGTGYRRWLRQRASALQIDGWVRNRSDRRVEGLVRGSRTDLAQLISDMPDGPESAEVDRVTIEPSTIRPKAGFRVRSDRVVRPPRSPSKASPFEKVVRGVRRRLRVLSDG